METYIWSGRTRDGQRQKGELAAKSKDEVISIMRKQNIMVTSVAARAKKLSINLPFLTPQASDKDIAIFTRQSPSPLLAVMLYSHWLSKTVGAYEVNAAAAVINEI